MPKAESYNDLIFQVGDLARERLANRPAPPRSLDRVLKAEQALLERQGELQELENQMNDEDAAYKDFVDQAAAEKEEQTALVKQYKRAVDVIEGRVRDLRKKLSKERTEQRFGLKSLKISERKLADWEAASADAGKIEMARQNIKKMRLQQMRIQKAVEELETQFNRVFEVDPDQPGAPGILAHKRIIDLEEELVTKKDEFDMLMVDLDAAIAAKEQELRAAEEYLDQATFLLGEECYAQRLSDPALAAFYPRLDKAQ
jgi:hypothetical protein